MIAASGTPAVFSGRNAIRRTSYLKKKNGRKNVKSARYWPILSAGRRRQQLAPMQASENSAQSSQNGENRAQKCRTTKHRPPVSDVRIPEATPFEYCPERCWLSRITMVCGFAVIISAMNHLIGKKFAFWPSRRMSRICGIVSFGQRTRAPQKDQSASGKNSCQKGRNARLAGGIAASTSA